MLKLYDSYFFPLSFRKKGYIVLQKHIQAQTAECEVSYLDPYAPVV
jgi:hypothetical protein